MPNAAPIRPLSRAAPPKPNRAEGAEAIRQIAHTRLDQLFEQAEEGRLFGIIGIEVSFEAGQPALVRRKIDGTDKVNRS